VSPRADSARAQRRLRRFPAAPLIDLLERSRRQRSMRAVIASAAVDRRTLERLRHRTQLRADSADRLATALGAHPAELWPDWFDPDPLP
jgi:lambda repressor-like predicted transcriptional regulator